MIPPRWSFFRKGLVVPNFDNPRETYLTRWRLIETPWFGVYLHRMTGPDSRRTLHDHPWNFCSVVLRGGYMEMRLNPKTRGVFMKTVRRFNRLAMYDAHAITRLLRNPTWTLVFVGKRRREWGYLQYLTLTGVEEVWTPHEKHHHHYEWERALEKRAEQRALEARDAGRL